jgi:circadian clock protein KaiC
MRKKELKFQRKLFPNPQQVFRDLMKSRAAGLPKGRPTLVCGGAGCGKTLFAMEFLVRGATMYNEPGVLFLSRKQKKNLQQMLLLWDSI